jgi:16S rRNA (adenine1518-N6/adenine1519-N6)-dimethyltransferase
MSTGHQSPKSLLTQHGIRAKRRFGQNFLTDANLAARIAELATAEPGGTVVEIGAGLGALTRPLLDRAARVVAIERDRELLPVLQETFAVELAETRLVLLEADARTVPLGQWLASGPRPHVVAGNLPYQITGPLLQKVTALGQQVARVVLLVQLEVAQRLVAPSGHQAYGALSVFVQAQFRPSREFVIRRGAFYPQPNVDSAVVALQPRQQALAVETSVLRALVKAAFEQRRKQLRNAWRGVLGLGQLQVAAAAQRASIDLSRRGESLTVSEFARMAEELEQ